MMEARIKVVLEVREASEVFAHPQWLEKSTTTSVFGPQYLVDNVYATIVKLLDLVGNALSIPR